MTITSVRFVNDTQDGVLELMPPRSRKTERSPVTISDGTLGDAVTVPLTVNIVTDSTVDEPYLESVPDIHMLAGRR